MELPGPQQSREPTPLLPIGVVKQFGRRSLLAWLAGIFAFAGINIYVLTHRFRSKSDPPLELIIFGPFNPKSYVPIATPENDVAETQSALIRQFPDGELRVKVEFTFKGTISQMSRIQVTATAMNADGRVLGEARTVCKDKRAWPIPRGTAGGATIQSDLVNRPNIVVPLAPRDTVSSLKLRFTRI